MVRPAGASRRSDGLAPTARGRPGGPARKVKLSFLLHSWLGLKLSLFLLLVSLTGTMATISYEIDWLIDERVRAARTATPASWGDLVAAVEARFPGASITHAAAAPGEGNAASPLPFAARFLVTMPDGTGRSVYVDPYSRRVTGVRSFDLPDFLRQLHYSLFLPHGIFLTTALGFVLAGGVTTGLLIHKKFWRGFFRLPRRDRGSRVFWGGLHRLGGVWSLWFLVLLSATSLWYLAEEILDRAGVPMYGQDAPRLTAGDLLALGPEIDGPLPLDDLVAIARSAMPGLETREILWAERPLGAVRVAGQANAVLVRDSASHVYLNPYTGEILRLQRAEDMSPFRRWSHTADPLHFGTFGGLASKLVWFAFGLALCAMTVSGTIVHLKRIAKATGASLHEQRDYCRKRPGRLPWLGRWKWLNLGLVAAPVVALLAGSTLPSAAPLQSLGAQGVGRWRAELLVDPANDPSGGLLVHVRFCAGCFQQFKAAFLDWQGAPRTLQDGNILSGAEYHLAIELPMDPGIEAGKPPPVELSIVDWDGAVHRAVWRVNVESSDSAQVLPGNLPLTDMRLNRPGYSGGILF